VRPLYHRVLVTGASGLVGRAVVERMAGMPETDLLATSREATPLAPFASGGYAPLDVRDPEAVRRMFDDFAPTAVVHCAGMSKVDACEADRDACWEVNVHATAALARACRASGARLVLLSTDFVFDGEDGPYDEAARPGPLNFYGRSKLAAENAVRSAGHERWAIVRTTLVFGAGEHVRRGNFATWLLARLAAGEAVSVPEDQLRTPTYALDLADGIAALVTRRRSGVYHMTGRELLRVVDFARQIARHFDLDESLISPASTARLHPEHPRPLRAGLLILKAETELGYRPRPLEASLDDLALRLGLPVGSR
jgi:dTDP-4-dehydrorhamnose reductase